MNVHQTRVTALLLTLGMAQCLPSLAANRAPTDATLPDRFTPLVLERGNDSQLPPHLSNVLGLNDKNQATRVRQIAMREGTVVHTFNVLASGHHQRVLLTHDEATQDTKVYGLRADGTLRVAVTYQGRGASRSMSPAAAREGYQREIQFWREHLRGRAPAQLPPATPAPGAAGAHP
jgi:hypothetical protein